MATRGAHSDLNQFPGNSNDILNIGNNQHYLISCEEEAFEPGFSVSLPLMFMEKFCDSIGLTSSAWVEVTPHLLLFFDFLFSLYAYIYIVQPDTIHLFSSYCASYYHHPH